MIQAQCQCKPVVFQSLLRSDGFIVVEFVITALEFLSTFRADGFPASDDDDDATSNKDSSTLSRHPETYCSYPSFCTVSWFWP